MTRPPGVRLTRHRNRRSLNHVGYGIAGLFVLVWVLALAIWRYGRIEEKWSAALNTPDGPTLP